MRPGLVPGLNVDRVDIAAGLAMLRKIGYGAPRTVMVIEYALMRWARGEEEQAERGAIDRGFYGIDLTSWRMVLAAACSQPASTKAERDHTDFPRPLVTVSRSIPLWSWRQVATWLVKTGRSR